MDSKGGENHSSEEVDDPLTPDEPKPSFEPMFSADITDVNKVNDHYVFYIKSIHMKENKEFFAKRDYTEFEWLNHSIHTKSLIDGIIVPPLPTIPCSTFIKPTSKPGTPEEYDRIVNEQELHRDGRTMQEYLCQLLNHPLLGSEESLYTFLTAPEIPNKAIPKQGIFGKLYSAVDGSRKANQRDIDDYFQKERDFANAHVVHTNDLSVNFNKVVDTKEKIVHAHAHLVTSLSMGNGFLLNTQRNVQANRLLVQFGGSMDKCKSCYEKDLKADENLACALDIAAKYACALKDMHYRRTCLLVAYEEANRALSKAKPNQADAAERTRLLAEKNFEECSEMARKQIASFHRQRAQRFRETLCAFAEAKLQIAWETHDMLTSSIAELKQVPT